MKLDKLQEAYDEMFDFITDLPSGLDGFESDFDAAYKELLEAKSAEDAPVVHGKWLEYQNEQDRGFHYCSNCKDQAFNYNDDNNEVVEVLSNYCPCCGAKMDLEEDK